MPKLERRNLYVIMQNLRAFSNSVQCTDRNSALQEIEELRKMVGGIQYSPMPIETHHKLDIELNIKGKRPEIFVTCPKCNRLLHYSVVGYGGCYSCSSYSSVSTKTEKTEEGE
jgi:hypothetical protein